MQLLCMTCNNSSSIVRITLTSERRLHCQREHPNLAIVHYHCSVQITYIRTSIQCVCNMLVSDHMMVRLYAGSSSAECAK
jgi:hypothetical protein